MRQWLTLTMLVVVFAGTFSCKKNADIKTTCLPDSKTVREITDKAAVVKAVNNQFYLIEQGTVDSKLRPCTLSQQFQHDNLNVTISGEVKATLQCADCPCCIEDFVITKISQ